MFIHHVYGGVQHMKPLLVICGLLVFVIGCATAPPQDSIQSKSVAATPSQPSQSIEAVTVPSTTPKMIEVAVKTEPTIQTRGSRLSQPTISVTPTPPTPSFDPQPFSLVLHDHTPSRTQAAHARLHEEIVIVPYQVSSQTRHKPRHVDVTIFSEESAGTPNATDTFIITPAP